MRLEIESAAAVPPSAENINVNGNEYDALSESQEYLRNGIKAAQSGRRAEARTALLRATELNPSSENAWLWLASISEYPEELLVFLNNVLDINPENERALEWHSATNSLLAKTLIQRGIDAAEEGQKDQAAEFFGKALEYDQQSALAWMWMASLSDSNEGKLLYLEKALSIDPENQSAVDAYRSARQAITAGHLADAKGAAVAGRTAEAQELLNAVLEEMPDSEEAWMLRSLFAESFDEKIASFERVLAINPSNAAASASLESLRSLIGDKPVTNEPEVITTEPELFATEPEIVATESPAPEDAQFTTEEPSVDAGAQSFFADSYSSEKHPSDNLEMPNGVAEAFESEEPEMLAAPEAEVNEEIKVVSDEADVPENEAAQAEMTNFVSEAEQHAFVHHFSDPDSYVNGEAFVPTESEPSQEMFAIEQPSHEEPLGAAEQSQFFAVEEVEVEQPVSFESVSDDDAIEEVHFDAIPLPSDSNPFEAPDDVDVYDPFSTMITRGPADVPASESSTIVDESLAASTPFDLPIEESPSFEPDFSQTMFSSSVDIFSQNAPVMSDSIPMPFADLGTADSYSAPTGYETTVAPMEPEERVEVPEVAVVEMAEPADQQPVALTAVCSFCATKNDVQAVSCSNCMAVLTLSDLEMVLSNQNADKAIIRSAVEVMEHERITRPYSEAELTMLGIGHLNLKNLDTGYAYLLEASKMNPNNVVLSSHVNSLHIRIEELKQKAETNGPVATGKKILVVDDSPTIRKLISGKLEKCGHDVYCSSDGIEAIAQLEEFQPDLVLLDITMPRMDGYQVCKLIRASEVTKDIPVVMISGKDGFFDKVRGRMAGTSGYITKPFGPETLMKVVESYLQSEGAIAVTE